MPPPPGSGATHGPLPARQPPSPDVTVISELPGVTEARGRRLAHSPVPAAGRRDRHAAVTGGYPWAEGGRHDPRAGPDPHADRVRRGGVLQQPGYLGDAFRRRGG